MIGIIDYGMGNLRSVQKALEFVGYEAVVSDNPELLSKADKLILPGVGAFAEAISTIRNKGFDKLILEAVEAKKHFLGICLGLQLIFDKSFENGEHQGLGLISGEITRLPDTVKIPHIGWNSLDIKNDSPLFSNLSENPYVYFVHSYYLNTEEAVVSATTFYGKDIQVAVQKENIFACQFHPEKSGDEGLKILKNFGGMHYENLSGY